MVFSARTLSLNREGSKDAKGVLGAEGMALGAKSSLGGS